MFHRHTLEKAAVKTDSHLLDARHTAHNLQNDVVAFVMLARLGLAAKRTSFRTIKLYPAFRPPQCSELSYSSCILQGDLRFDSCGSHRDSAYDIKVPLGCSNRRAPPDRYACSNSGFMISTASSTPLLCFNKSQTPCCYPIREYPEAIRSLVWVRVVIQLGHTTARVR